MTPSAILTPDELRDVVTYVDAIDLLAERGVLTDAELCDLTGFGLLPGNQKHRLLDVPFFIIQYEIKPGISGDDYADIWLVTTTDQRWRMRDSSSGIRKQLKEIHARRVDDNHPNPNMAVEVRKGLRFVEFEYHDNLTGKTSKPRTYYLNMD